MDIQNITGLVLNWIAQALLFGTLLALLTWALLRCVGRRLHPGLHAALWLIVLLKFVVPVGPGSSFSLASMTRNAAGLFSERVPETARSAMQQAHADTAGYIAWLAVDEQTAPIAVATPQSTIWRVGTIACVLYLVGVIVTASVRLWSYRRFAARCRSCPQADSDITHLVARVCHALGVRRTPDVCISELAPAPYVLGFLHPTLVLSRRQLQCPDELEAVVLHEVAHLRRGDLIVRYLQWCAGTLLFFWPVVAWVNRRIDLAREHACDEWALRHGQLSAGQYARCLLRAVHPVQPRGWAYRPAAMATNPKTIERRIEMILDTPVSNRLSRLMRLPVLLLILAWSGFALTGAAVAGDQDADNGADEPKGHHFVTVIKTVDQGGEETVDVRVEMLDGAADIDAVRVRLAEHGIDLDELRSRFPAGDEPVWIQKMRLHHDIGELAEDGDGPRVHMIMLNLTEELSSFAEEHPNADVDGDGSVSRFERDAYLVALAMNDPAGFMNQFPKADVNEDGELEVVEAARTIRSGVMQMFFESTAHAIHAAGHEAHAVVEADIEDADGNVTRIEIKGGGTAIFVRKSGDDPDFVSPSDWLLENVTAEPTAEEVTSYLSAVEVSCGSPPMWIDDAGGENAIIERLMEIHKGGLSDKENVFIHELHGEGGGARFITIHRLGDHVEVEIEVTSDGEL